MTTDFFGLKIGNFWMFILHFGALNYISLQAPLTLNYTHNCYTSTIRHIDHPVVSVGEDGLQEPHHRKLQDMFTDFEYFILMTDKRYKSLQRRCQNVFILDFSDTLFARFCSS